MTRLPRETMLLCVEPRGFVTTVILTSVDSPEFGSAQELGELDCVVYCYACKVRARPSTLIRLTARITMPYVRRTTLWLSFYYLLEQRYPGYSVAPHTPLMSSSSLFTCPVCGNRLFVVILA